MSLRTAVLVTIVAVCASCARAPEGATTARDTAPVLGEPTLAERRAAYDSRARLPIDRRIVAAVAEVHHIVSGWQRGDVTARFVAARSDAPAHWTIDYLEREVGTLPDPVDFGDALAMLASWCERLQREHPLRMGAPEPFVAGNVLFAEEAISLLRAAQTGWLSFGGDAVRSPRLLHDATRGLVSLAAQVVDDCEIADPLFARALAVLAVEKGTGAPPATTARWEAVLADAMGYGRAAAAVSTALASDDAVRAWVTADDATLAGLAERSRPGEVASTRWWWLRRRLARGDRRGQRPDGAGERPLFSLSAPAPASPLPPLSPMVLAARIGSADPSERARAAHALASIALLAVAREAGVAGADRAADELRALTGSDADLARAAGLVLGWLQIRRDERVGRFETSNAKAWNSDGGPFLDGSVARAFWRALFASAIHRRVVAAWTGSGTWEAAVAALDEEIGDDVEPLAVDLRRWVGAHGEATKEAPPGRPIDRAPDALGVTVMHPLVSAISDEGAWHPADVRAIALRLFARADSRPSHRALAADVAARVLLDRPLADSLSAAAVALAPGRFPVVEVERARREHAIGALRTLAARNDLPADLRADAFDALYPDVLPDRALFDRLGTDADPALSGPRADSWEDWAGVVRFLVRRGADARPLVDAWLARHAYDRPAARFAAKVARAEASLAEADAKDAWETTQSLEGAPSEEDERAAAAVAIRAAAALGRPDEAVPRARALRVRWSSPRTLALLVETLWRSGYEEAAADVFRDTPSTTRGEAGALIARALVASTTDVSSPPASAHASPPAFAAYTARLEAVRRALGEWRLLALAEAVDRAGAPLLAHALLTQPTHSSDRTDLAPRERPRPLDALSLDALSLEALSLGVARYRYARSAGRSVPTLDPGPLVFPLARYAYGAHQDALLWSAIPDPPAWEPSADFVWLLRAAAMTRGRDRDAVHRRALEGWLSEAPPGDRLPWRAIARWLLGGTGASPDLTVRDRRRACATSYYLGLAAQAAGRSREANAWYQTALDTGETSAAELAWARDALANLSVSSNE